MKGLQRSINRGPDTHQDVQNLHYTISGALDITGVDSAVDAGSFVIGGLPQGNILVLGAVSYVAVDGGADVHIIDNWNGDYGIGTIPNADVDLADAGDDNIIPSTVLDAGASDKLAPRTRATSTEAVEQGAILDNTDGSLELNFNLLIDDNVITDTEDGSFTITGDLFLAIVVLGDD
jgi:predicted  nucleic acid-binding Zn-ribbon protein